MTRSFSLFHSFHTFHTFLTFLTFLTAAPFNAKAEGMKLDCGASADLVSTYMWRGIYNGGLSFQPDLNIGLSNNDLSLSLGTWWSLGASDWGFRHGLDRNDIFNPNTKFNKELNVYLNAEFRGMTLALTHYYYFDGTDFFNLGRADEINGTAQTEVSLGYDFSSLADYCNLSVTWNTIVAGDDAYVDENQGLKRAYSTYIETAYRYPFRHNISLTGIVGFSPWKGIYTDREKNFAVNCLSVLCDKQWELKNGIKLTLYGQLMMNTCNLNSHTAIIKASGDDKLYQQKLQAALGLNITL